MKLLTWLKWLLTGMPSITYPGYHCGCCGKWVNDEFSIPTYKSIGKQADTWGLCPDCGNPNTNEDWLLKKAAQEDGAIVSVGGLISKLSREKQKMKGS